VAAGEEDSPEGLRLASAPSRALGCPRGVLELCSDTPIKAGLHAVRNASSLTMFCHRLRSEVVQMTVEGEEKLLQDGDLFF
jgi:hypothetical protein